MTRTAVATALPQLRAMGDPRPTVTDLTRIRIAGLAPDKADRRNALRQVAQEADEFEPQLLHILVGALTDSTLTPAERTAGWRDLLDAVETLALLGAGEIQPREVEPGARGVHAQQAAADRCEADIAAALEHLVRS